MKNKYIQSMFVILLVVVTMFTACQDSEKNRVTELPMDADKSTISEQSEENSKEAGINIEDDSFKETETDSSIEASNSSTQQGLTNSYDMFACFNEDGTIRVDDVMFKAYFMGLLQNSWSKPEEINVEDIMTAFEYSLVNSSENFEYVHSIKETDIVHIPAKEIENILLENVGIPLEYLHTSTKYNESDDSYIFKVLDGLGGGVPLEAINLEETSANNYKFEIIYREEPFGELTFETDGTQIVYKEFIKSA